MSITFHTHMDLQPRQAAVLIKITHDTESAAPHHRIWEYGDNAAQHGYWQPLEATHIGLIVAAALFKYIVCDASRRAMR